MYDYTSIQISPEIVSNKLINYINNAKLNIKLKVMNYLAYINSKLIIDKLLKYFNCSNIQNATVAAASLALMQNETV